MIVGWIRWKIFCFRNGIYYPTVVIVLTGDNEKLDEYALLYLEDFMKRKSAEKAFIICTDDRKKRFLEQKDRQRILEGQNVSIKILSQKKLEMFYDFYSVYKCYDNLVFTYISQPKENMLERVLKETDVNEEDAVCLALYHLRCIPRTEEKGFKCMPKS